MRQASTCPGPPADGIEGPSLPNPRAVSCPLLHTVFARKAGTFSQQHRHFLFLRNYPNHKLMELSQNELVQLALTLPALTCLQLVSAPHPCLLQLPWGATQQPPFLLRCSMGSTVQCMCMCERVCRWEWRPRQGSWKSNASGSPSPSLGLGGRQEACW